MSREDVIREIVAREANHEILSEEVVLQENPTLHGQACEFFGTWKTALVYSGVTAPRTRQERSNNAIRSNAVRKDPLGPQEVIKEIQLICWSDHSLSARVIKARNRKLHAAALKHFGSWRAAVTAAGVNREHAVPDAKSNPYTRESLIEQLRTRHEKGLTLVGVRVSLEDRRLTRAVKKTFGTWTKGVDAAGLSHTVLFTNAKWDRELILKTIHDLSQQGQSLQCSRVRKTHSGLVTAARRFFSKWDDAVAAAGCSHQGMTQT